MPSKKDMAALQAKHDALESKVNALTKEKGTLTKDLAMANETTASAVTQCTTLERELETSRADAGKHRGAYRVLSFISVFASASTSAM